MDDPAALEEAGLPGDSILYIDSPGPRWSPELPAGMDQFVDMIILRGGNALHWLCREQATIPVMTGGIGICHLFVDASARPDQGGRDHPQRQDAAPDGLAIRWTPCWYTATWLPISCRMAAGR